MTRDNGKDDVGRGSRPSAVHWYRHGALPVVTVVGCPTEVGLRTCRHTLDAVMREQPAWVAVDLARARFTEASIGTLSLMRRFLRRRGAEMCLVGASAETEGQLRRTGVLSLYRVFTDAESARAALGLGDTYAGRRRG